MENENGNLNQSKSKAAGSLKDFLELIILGKDSVLEEFSDKQLIQNLTYLQSENTVRKIREQLERSGVIKKVKTGSHGEKFYKIKDFEKAVRLYRENIGLHVFNRKNIPKIALTSFGKIKNPPKKLDSNFLMRLITKNMTREWLYPKTNYKKGICPICFGKLQKSKLKRLSSHDMNRKCTNCRCEFMYKPTSFEKAITNQLNEKDYIIIDTLGNDISNYLVYK